MISEQETKIEGSTDKKKEERRAGNAIYDEYGWIVDNEIKPPTEEDVEVLKTQLKGKTFTSPDAITKYCKWGYPQVTFASCSRNIEKNGFVPGTFLWLTCPRINYIVDRLEEQETFDSIREEFHAVIAPKRKIKEQNKQSKKQKDLESSSNSKNENETTTSTEENLLMKSFENYDDWLLNKAVLSEGEEKGKHLLTKEEFEMWRYSARAKDLENNTIPLERKRYGNAGVSCSSSIKCLHSHISSYLSGSKDFVGKRVFEEGKQVVTNILEEDIEDLLNPLDCRSNCIKCKQAMVAKQKK
ncbi:hypothetical protein ABK040_001883 [Willaertia magna]